MVEYPDAPRHISATPALLEGWCGPCHIRVDLDMWTDAATAGDSRRFTDRYGVCSGQAARLDPMRPEVRDHLIRRLSLPSWMRDGAGLEPWQSAALIACAAAGSDARALLGPWVRWGVAGVPAGFSRYDRRRIVGDGPEAHYYDGRKRWPYSGAVPHSPAKSDALLVGGNCALMLDVDTTLLPWPGGPRVWRRTFEECGGHDPSPPDGRKS